MTSALARRAVAARERLWVAAQAARWPPYSRLFLVGDNAAWVLTQEMRAVARLARGLGLPVASLRAPLLVRRQAVFHASHFALREPATFAGEHRLAVSYYHGRPGGDEPVFDQCFAILRREHARLSRVQVSHRAMQAVVLESGIAPEKVRLIPIGLDIELFAVQTPATRAEVRAQLGVPQSAVVIGSFQKDGVGWGEGLEPKMIKGPDVFLDTVAGLRARVPDLFVLLSGAARGFVKAGLERMGVPYRHVYVGDYRSMGELYHALDLYLVTSREEGGPKAVLEAMACGVPLVSTRVGQATDLVEHGQNGWLTDVEDVEALVGCAHHAIELRAQLAGLLACGRATAEANSYMAQLPLWQSFFDGFVERR